MPVPRNLKPLKLLLNSRTAPLGAVLHRVRQQRDLLERLRSLAPRELGEHISHAEVRHGELLIYVDTSAWATRARYFGPQIIAGLNRTGIRGINGVKIRVLPEPGTPSGGRRRSIALSTESAALIESTARALANGDLRDSLLRLSRRGTRR
ncbi:MAG: hypothetical protein Kow006_26450 [Gammaproteobacteria bacterium]